jgi:hypothetical protein
MHLPVQGAWCGVGPTPGDQPGRLGRMIVWPGCCSALMNDDEAAQYDPLAGLAGAHIHLQMPEVLVRHKEASPAAVIWIVRDQIRAVGGAGLIGVIETYRGPMGSSSGRTLRGRRPGGCVCWADRSDASRRTGTCRTMDAASRLTCMGEPPNSLGRTQARPRP